MKEIKKKIMSDDAILLALVFTGIVFLLGLIFRGKFFKSLFSAIGSGVAYYLGASSIQKLEAKARLEEVKEN